MKDDFLIQVNLSFVREMRLLAPKQPKAVALMEEILAEMDEGNDSIIPLEYLCAALKLGVEPILDMARTIQQMGWLEAIVYDHEQLFAKVNKDYARVVQEEV
jgi:L-rhamnose isomerase